MSEEESWFGRQHVPAASYDLRPYDTIMRLAFTTSGPVKQISVAGEVDMSNAHLLVELVADLARTPPPVVAMDLSEITYFGAHGISALLQARQLLIGRGGQLTLRNLSPTVCHLVTVTGTQRELGLADPLPVAQDRSTTGMLPATT